VETLIDPDWQSSRGTRFMDPKTLQFTPTHEWAHIQGDVATFGLSQFAVEQLTDLTAIDLPAVGARLAPGEKFGEVESVKSVNDLFAPVGGEVIEVNGDVVKTIELLSEDPYGKGWLIRVKMDQAALPSDLLDFDAYQKKVAEEDH
jgi:glycine cleavage system H protein